MLRQCQRQEEDDIEFIDVLQKLRTGKMDDGTFNFLQEHCFATKNKKKIKQYLADDVPLKLAWAKLIHKSQGETYGRVIVKLPDVEFANGLTLVALSRA